MDTIRESGTARWSGKIKVAKARSQSVEVSVDTLEAIEPFRERTGMAKKELVDRVLRHFSRQQLGAQMLIVGLVYGDSGRAEAAARLAYEAEPDHDAVMEAFQQIIAERDEAEKAGK